MTAVTANVFLITDIRVYFFEKIHIRLRRSILALRSEYLNKHHLK